MPDDFNDAPSCPECNSDDTSYDEDYGWVTVGDDDREVYAYRCNEPDCGVGFLVDDRGHYH